MYRRERKVKAGPMKTFRFIDDEHKDLFDRHKISFEEATIEVVEEPYLEMITSYKAKQLSKELRNYVYPEGIKAGAKSFLIVDSDNGNVIVKRYLYTYQLIEWVECSHLAVYVTNK